MKFTLGWLKDYLETDASASDIADVLTRIGLELEEFDDPGETFAPFKVAYVESAEKHPDADKLKVCRVKTQNETFQVVCGAPNARAGMKGIFAPESTYIPGIDLTLKKAKIRGIESCGMLVSEREMCLSDEHDGIIEVDEKWEIGTPMAEIFGLDDPIFEIGLTPNRADCAGIYGIARDLAAAGLGTLKPLNDTPVKGSFPSSVSVSIDDQEGCPEFFGRTIKGVKNGPSPDWLQNRLKAIGLRPISTLVDITNYINIGLCRPLHVYDIGKLQGNIQVRTAKQGESFDALNDKSYEMLGGETAICDDSGLIGLGGIVGGVSTSCDDDTRDVFLECAYFDPMRIARSGRDLQVISDARYRFERGVDPLFTRSGIEIATQMIVDLCGGDVSEVVQAGAIPAWDKTISYDCNYVHKLIGIDVPETRQIEILEALGFECSSSEKGTYEISVPPWRGDIFGIADIAEEVIRIEGFDKIESVSVRADDGRVASAETLMISRTRKARNALTMRGLSECVTWSFLNLETANFFGANDNPALTLSNPISEDMNYMRPSILPNLMMAAQRNHDLGNGDGSLCEVGPTFQSPKPDGQSIVAAGIRCGKITARHWSDDTQERTADTYDAKADALAALEACGAPVSNAQISRNVPDHYHPGRAGAICLGRNVLAYFGEIHPAIVQEMGYKNSFVGFEVFLDNIPEAKKQSGKKSGTEKPFLKLASLQPITRDFAFVVENNLDALELSRCVKAADKTLIADVQIFDIYTGPGVEEGKKSVALCVTILPQDKTMTDKDIEEISGKIINQVGHKLNGTLRG